MDPLGYWLIGYFVLWFCVAVMGLILSPVMDYDGDNELLFRIGDAAEDFYSSFMVVMLLVLPVATVWGCYLIGERVWSYIK